MTTFWDAMPSDAELELWWLTEAEEVPLSTAAERVGIEAGRAEEVVERVEAFLQAAQKLAEAGRREREGDWAAGAKGLERVENLLAAAAGAMLDSLRERLTVRVEEKGGRIDKLVITLDRPRPKRDWLRAVTRLARLRRERIEVCGDALRRPRDRRGQAVTVLRLAGPDGAARGVPR